MTGFVFILAVFPGTSLALDGGVDVRSSNQTNQVDGTNFGTSSLREMIYMRQGIQLAEPLLFDAHGRWTRDLVGSDFTPQSPDAERTSWYGGLRLGYQIRSTALGASGSWLHQDDAPGPSISQELHRSDYQLWLKTLPLEGGTLRASVSQRDSRRMQTLAPRFRSRERSGSLNTEYLSGIGAFRYRLSVLSVDGLSSRTQQRQWGNMLEYGEAGRFAGDRLSASVRLRSSFFNQSSKSERPDENRLLLVPVSGGVRSDDTPDVQDPLEEDLSPVPELFDRDRDAPTPINIGDSPPPAREYGGDYRNIQMDFGSSEPIVAATLYVDSRLLHPELFRWRVFVSDDPEGFLWEEIDPASLSVDYMEWDTGLQGWVVTLPAVSGRFFKMVDVKLGITVPDLFVTELEVYTRDTATVAERSSSSQDHRFDGRLAYDATDRLRVIYDTTLREKRLVGGRNLSERNHSLSSQYRWGRYVVSGQVQWNRDWREEGKSTEFRNYQLAATRGNGTRFSTQAAWSRSEDDLGGRNRATDIFSLGAIWKAAPRLRFRQRIAYGVRSEPDPGSRSNSITVVTAVESRPVPSLIVNLDRSDRWVNQESGAGFQEFNETGIRIDWSPFPRISVSNYAKYFVRERSDWIVRSLGSWTLLNTGTMELGVSGSSFRDTRTDGTQQGVSANAKWKLRSRMVVDGSVGFQRLKTAGRVDTPVATNLHAAWTF